MKKLNIRLASLYWQVTDCFYTNYGIADKKHTSIEMWITFWGLTILAHTTGDVLWFALSMLALIFYTILNLKK